jgi:hypothetical protein
VLRDLHTGAAVTVRGGSFGVELDPGDGRFFVAATPAVADRLHAESVRRHYGKLQRLYASELEEATAARVDTAEATQHAEAAEQRLAAGGTAEALAMLQKAQEALDRGFSGKVAYRRCREGIEEVQTVVGRVNAAYEEYLMAIPWERHQLEYSQPRRIAAAMYKPHGDMILAAARHWYRLRYGLMNGKLGECNRALPACLQLAKETERLVGVLVNGKKHKTNAMWQLYHPITPRVRELMERCDELTKPLEEL